MNIDEMLPKVKEVELEILCVVDEFCKKYNLKYSLAYGTLLGAIRHKGFIPWDDDIDIWMPREDYEKFIELWLKQPVDGYIIQNTDLEPDFTQNYTKIRKDHTTFLQPLEEKYNYHKGVFIDIFPLDRVSKTNNKKQLQKIYAVLTLLFYRRFTPPTEQGIKKFISQFLLFIVPSSKHNKMLRFFEDRYLSLCGDNTCEYISNSTFNDISIYYDAKILDSFVEMKFEDKTFMVVENWKNALEMQYGNYMQLPLEEDRVWKHHPILIDLEHNYEDIVSK